MKSREFGHGTASRPPRFPSIDDLMDGIFEGDGDIPRGVITAHLGQVADVADVVSDAIFIKVSVDLFLAGEFFGQGESLEDGARIVASAAEVVDRGDPGGR